MRSFSFPMFLTALLHLLQILEPNAAALFHMALPGKRSLQWRAQRVQLVLFVGVRRWEPPGSGPFKTRVPSRSTSSLPSAAIAFRSFIRDFSEPPHDGPADLLRM